MSRSLAPLALAALLAACSSESDPAASSAGAAGSSGSAGSSSGASGASGASGGPAASDEVLPPAPPGQALRITTESFAVEPGEEVQDCYFYKVSDLAKQAGLPEDRPVNVSRYQIGQRAGSHHMNIFRVRTVTNLGPEGGAVQRGKNGQGACFMSSNWADWPLVANTQESGQFDWQLPEGVVTKLAPDEWLMLQTHYVNASTQKTPEGTGRVDVNLWVVPDDQAKVEMGTLFATKQSIRICKSNPEPVFDGTCQFNSQQPVTIIGANAHFHARGTSFDMFSWDGKSITTPPDSSRFYRSERWDEPPMMTSPKLEQTVPAGGGVWYSCAYEWRPPADEIGCGGLDKFDGDKYMTPESERDCCYTFGPVVDRNEHCNIFVYYYPKVDDVNCF